LVGHEQVGGGEHDTQRPQAWEALRCPACGHALTGGDGCAHCGGELRELADAPRPLRHGRGWVPLDLWRGAATFARAAGQALHHRAFVGRLKLAIAANVVAAATIGLGAFALWPALDELFAGEWPLLDGWRRAHAGTAPTLLLLATLWQLWPVWFEVVCGAAVEPLVAATETAIGGSGMAAAPAAPRAVAERVHRRARLLASQLLLLPLSWIVALLPWVGPPLVFLGTAAIAAHVWCELPAERRHLPPRQRHALLLRNWPLALGFGVGCQVAVMIPVLNVVLLAPAAAIGAAVLHFRFEKTGHPS
jgi:hypothetical protein